MNNQYGGMTVNERLYVSGLMEDFDKAVKQKEVETIISILKNIEVDDASIDLILEGFGLRKI